MASEWMDFVVPPGSSPESALHHIIFSALGAASMCWSIVPKGVFDAECAKEIGEATIEALQEWGLLS